MNQLHPPVSPRGNLTISPANGAGILDRFPVRQSHRGGRDAKRLFLVRASVRPSKDAAGKQQAGPVYGRGHGIRDGDEIVQFCHHHAAGEFVKIVAETLLNQPALQADYVGPGRTGGEGVRPI